MRHGWIGGWAMAGLLLAVSGIGWAGTVPPGGLERAKVVYQHKLDPQSQEGVLAPQSQPASLTGPARRPGPALSLDAKRQIAMLPAALQVPAEDPAYIVFEAAATKPGRLVVHLQPADIPADMKDKVQKEDWADPKRHYDMRALVTLQPGRVAAVRDRPEPRHVRGDHPRQEPLQPGRPEDQGHRLRDQPARRPRSAGARQRRPRDRALDAAGRQGYLQAQMDQLRAPLEIMGSDSPIAAYWRPIVNELNMATIGFDPGSPAQRVAGAGRPDRYPHPRQPQVVPGGRSPTGLPRRHRDKPAARVAAAMPCMPFAARSA